MSSNQAAVIGNPISHSLSPGIFSFLAQKLGRSDFTYHAHEIELDRLGEFMCKFRAKKNFLGLNVTLPHKETILKFLDQLTPEVQTIGSANVVQKNGNLLYGHNTDVHGIFATLKKYHCEVKGKRVFVFGAGGAARSIAYVLGTQKARRVEFFNRNMKRTQLLVDQFRSVFPETEFHIATDISKDAQTTASSIDLWINTTPLGMSSVPRTAEGQLAFDFFSHSCKALDLHFSKNAFAFDLIYRPEKTPFLQLGKQMGLTPMGGLDMLVEQALQTWKIWFGSSDLERLKPELFNYLRYPPIFLTGFMGSGKSTVGAILAKKMGWKFLDCDLLIEQEAQMPISQLFATKGEAAFREIESKVIRQSAFSSRTVIALGGGALMHAETYKSIAQAGQLIYLSAQPHTLFARLKSEQNKRPLLSPIFAEKDLNEQRLKLGALLKKRQENYQKATIKIDTDGLLPEEVALKLFEEIEK